HAFRCIATELVEVRVPIVVLRNAFRLGAVRRDFRRPLARLPYASDAYACGHCGGKPDAGSTGPGAGGVARVRWPGGADRASRRREWQRAWRMPAGGGRARRALKFWQAPISAISPIPPTWREPMRLPSDLRASCARGWFAASKSAGAGGGSTCGVRSIAMYRM